MNDSTEQVAQLKFPDATESPERGGGLTLAYEESVQKVRTLALRQLDRLISFQASVLRGDDVEAIHDMRVASRRLQQTIELLYPKPQAQDIRRLRRQVRRCRQVLGEVRNCDVLLERTGRLLKRKRAARREVWEALHHYLQSRRSEAFAEAARNIGKINLPVLYVTLKNLLSPVPKSSPVAVTKPGTPPAPHPSFAQDLTQALVLTWARFEGDIERSHQDPKAEIIHGARISTKRLRYLLEIFHEFEVRGTKDALACLRGLQEDLGDWHDLEVLEQTLLDLLARKDFLRDHLPLAVQIQKFILHNRKNKAGLEKEYFRISRGSPEMERLKAWVTNILESPADLEVKSHAAGAA
jgi:CHAD domain-containing protein